MKKLLLPRLAFLIVTVVTCVPLVAQTNGLALTLINYTVQNDSNVNLGYTITINAQITNTDTANSFTGVLDFGLRNSAQVLTQNNSIFKKPPYSSDSVILNPGETVPAIFSVDIETPYFAPGPDVVVVWPISNKPVSDSILIELNVVGPNSISKEPEAEFNYIISLGVISLQGLPYQKHVKQVRIYNISGQVLIQHNSGINTEIPLGTLPKGIYLCEVYLSDKSRKVIKFVQ
jgi:hypothetical protein